MSSTSVFKLASLLCAAVLVLSAGCSDDARTPTAPTPPISLAGNVTGLLRGEAPSGNRIPLPHPPLSNATVTVIGGPASGIKTTTGADGTYQLVGVGTFKLRFEHPSFITRESNEIVMSADGAMLPEVTLLTAPWTISGLVTDSLGNPVPDAEVTIGSGTAFALPYGVVKTDAAGRYALDSTRPHFERVPIRAWKPGFESMQELPVACCGTAPVIRLVRIVSITPTAPSSLRVGESVEMPASVVVFDNGVTRNIFVLPTSNVPSVVNVLRSDHWYKMTGFRAGDATLTFDLWGAVATLQVSVR